MSVDCDRLDQEAALGKGACLVAGCASRVSGRSGPLPALPHAGGISGSAAQDRPIRHELAAGITLRDDAGRVVCGEAPVGVVFRRRAQAQAWSARRDGRA